MDFETLRKAICNYMATLDNTEKDEYYCTKLVKGRSVLFAFLSWLEGQVSHTDIYRSK